MIKTAMEQQVRRRIVPMCKISRLRCYCLVDNQMDSTGELKHKRDDPVHGNSQNEEALSG